MFTNEIVGMSLHTNPTQQNGDLIDKMATEFKCRVLTRRHHVPCIFVFVNELLEQPDCVTLHHTEVDDYIDRRMDYV